MTTSAEKRPNDTSWVWVHPRDNEPCQNKMGRYERTAATLKRVGMGNAHQYASLLYAKRLPSRTDLAIIKIPVKAESYRSDLPCTTVEISGALEPIAIKEAIRSQLSCRG